MPRAFDLYLRDILQAIDRIAVILQDLDEDAFKANDVRVDGILFNLMTIGEAVKNIPDDILAQIPEVRWRNIARFRDRVAHHYFTLDLAVVWEILQVHLPILREHVHALLQTLEDDDDAQQ